MRRSTIALVAGMLVLYADRMARTPALAIKLWPLDVVDQKLSSVTPIGNYALQPNWADGHNYGIWTFEKLRELG